MPAERPYASTSTTLMGARAAELATEQRGVILRTQLVECGFANATISKLAAAGQLRRVWPGVYAHGHAVLTRDGWLMAAALACGDGSQLAARASASARGLLTPWSTIDVITPTKRGVTLPGIRAIRADLHDDERDVHRGLPVTSLARTALDLAAREGYDRTGELLDRALLRDQYDHAEMRGLLRARHGCRGMATLRLAVAALGDEGVVFRSRPERLARDVLRGTDLPQPRVNAWFPTRNGHGYELDLWFAGLRRNLEIDGPQHELPHQRRKDELRDADLRAFGVRVLRVRDTVVTEAPERFLAITRAFVERP